MAAIGAGTSIASAIYGYHQDGKAAKAEQAAYRSRAHFTMLQADALLGAARAQAAAAGFSVRAAGAAVRAGKANASYERTLAARVQPVEDLNLQQANARRREKIGEGRVAFAANGILVDSGAAAKWERDEVADAAIEKLQIMQSAEEQVQGHLWNAAARRAEGYGAAGSAYGQAGAAYSAAAQTASSAYATTLQALGALQQAGAVQKPSALALGLNIAGAAFGAAGKIYGANAGSGAAQPQTGDASAPSVSDIYWRTPSSQRASGGMQIA